MTGPRHSLLFGAALLLTLLFGCTTPNKSGVYYASGKDAVTPDGRLPDASKVRARMDNKY